MENAHVASEIFHKSLSFFGSTFFWNEKVTLFKILNIGCNKDEGASYVGDVGIVGEVKMWEVKVTNLMVRFSYKKFALIKENVSWTIQII